MRKQQLLDERRRRNQELARIDAENRCDYCKLALPAVGRICVFGDPHWYCSDDCSLAAMARREHA